MTSALHAVPAPPPETQIDELVRRRLEIDRKIEELGTEKTQIGHQLEQLVGVGNTYATPFGVKVSVSPPSRTFHLDTAVKLLRHRDETALERCHREPGYDPAKVKKALTGDELEWSMLPGKGTNVIRVV